MSVVLYSVLHLNVFRNDTKNVCEFHITTPFLSWTSGGAGATNSFFHTHYMRSLHSQFNADIAHKTLPTHPIGKIHYFYQNAWHYYSTYGMLKGHLMTVGSLVLLVSNECYIAQSNLCQR